MHVNETDLPLTITRRRITTSSTSVNSNVNYIPPEDVIKPKISPFSSFANLSASLWSSAQNCLVRTFRWFHAVVDCVVHFTEDKYIAGTITLFDYHRETMGNK
ncbi:putative syntaxin-5 [Dirofilaria immitis]